jgi:hypothetical protein
VPEDYDIGGWRWQVVFAAKGKDTVLEWRSSRFRSPSFPNQSADWTQSPAPVTTCADSLELRHPQQVQSIRFLEGLLEAMLINHFCKIEEGSGDGGDRDPINDGAVPAAYPTLVYGDSGPLPSRHGSDIDPSAA